MSDQSSIEGWIRGTIRPVAGRSPDEPLPDDWARVTALADQARLGPLLYHAIRDQERVPGAVEETWRVAYLSAALYNTLLYQAWEAVAERFVAANIPVILLKGAALAETVYENRALRPFGDVDILVRREHVKAAVAVLTTAGYTASHRSLADVSHLNLGGELVFHKSGDHDTSIDLHWTLIDLPYYARRLAMDWFWATARPLSIGRSPTLTLGPEALVLYLSAHLALHHDPDLPNSLLWWLDLVHVFDHYSTEIDWELVLAKAAEFEIVLALQRLLPRLSAEWGAPIPALALETLAEMPASAGERRVMTWLQTRDSPAAPRFLGDLATAASWSERLRIGLAYLFPSPAYMRQQYTIQHRWLTPFYYPYRWSVWARRLLARKKSPGS